MIPHNPYKALLASAITFIVLCVIAGIVFDRGFFIPAIATGFILVMGLIITFWSWYFTRKEK